jgi:hypothetical protein
MPRECVFNCARIDIHYLPSNAPHPAEHILTARKRKVPVKTIADGLGFHDSGRRCSTSCRCCWIVLSITPRVGNRPKPKQGCCHLIDRLQRSKLILLENADVGARRLQPGPVTLTLCRPAIILL